MEVRRGENDVRDRSRGWEWWINKEVMIMGGVNKIKG